MITLDTLHSVLIDGILASIAAIGFAVLSNPPRKAILISAILAAIGHSLRFFLINSGVEISLASFAAATAVGLFSVIFARLIHCPAEVFAFPSLLPMIPGMYAYRTILSLIKFMQSTDDILNQAFFMDFFHNGITTVFVLFALVVGVSLPILLFPKHSYSVTRKY
jgi:uncharacterized membrane protein YjjB (DUF3815 family)